MSIADKLMEIADKIPQVYNSGFQKGMKEAEAEASEAYNPLYYATQPATLFIGADFPADENLILRFEKSPKSFSQTFFNAACPRSVKIIIENPYSSISIYQAFRITSATPNLVSVDLTGIGVINDASHAFDAQKLLEEVIGDLDLSDCTGTNGTTNVFRSCNALREVRFKDNTIPASIGFANCPLLSDNSIQSIINGLITITDGVARTVTFHANVELSSEQEATIEEKGWTLVQ